jgi:hypothetical protein
METLKNILIAQTAEFKAAFMAKTQVYAENEFNRQTKIDKWTKSEWCEFFGLTPQVTESFGKTYVDFPRGFHNTKDAKTYLNMSSKAYATIRNGQGAFIIKSLEIAEKHYIDSIEKLAARVESKNLNAESIEVTSGFQGINFECTITDGIKKVRAFTIIAEGEIVRPHYRYLIK